MGEVKGRKREEAGEEESWNGTGHFCGGLKTSDPHTGRSAETRQERARDVEK